MKRDLSSLSRRRPLKRFMRKSNGAPRKALKLAGDSVYNAIEEDKLEIDSDLVYERDEEEESGSFWSFLPFVSG